MDEGLPIDASEAQLEAIRREVAHYPLLSLSLPLNKESMIVKEMEHDDAYLAQTLSLFGASPVSTKQYDFDSIRYSRRDGNCFYRCAGFRLCELIVEHPERAAEYVALLKSREESLSRLFGLFVFDFTDALAEILRGVTDKTITSVAQVYDRFISEDGAYVLAALRYLISAYLQEHEEEYEPFVSGLGYGTVRDYCNAEVELVDHESDNVQLAAFAKAFNVCIKVYALDRNAGNNITEYSFNGEDNDTGDRLVVRLLYMPGHYNLLGRGPG
ncbi:otubain cysteine peptidase, Clan CA, family C65,putative [Leishmania mexicana MHOM/GT/2001/U1103]|uniref:ubiquitinyl hydrolase 1 n=1 Tax=Leishmania mexicana (strain MHOM/GT/2001/U1103) TaxID=929439 RepID=E9ARB4_LEIMU|nr:otubain cysteine peptidase, Clan CA, family C65,putative [Leishmania mexicana MHOM/GT/2001/U1103]CBZ25501.1 otubain cysteine peptidase, Clan CA, family C65,putative [Leishmania mexicana MHOM/GT/2001/U1103]